MDPAPDMLEYIILTLPVSIQVRLSRCHVHTTQSVNVSHHSWSNSIHWTLLRISRSLSQSSFHNIPLQYKRSRARNGYEKSNYRRTNRYRYLIRAWILLSVTGILHLPGLWMDFAVCFGEFLAERLLFSKEKMHAFIVDLHPKAMGYQDLGWPGCDIIALFAMKYEKRHWPIESKWGSIVPIEYIYIYRRKWLFSPLVLCFIHIHAFTKVVN